MIDWALDATGAVVALIAWGAYASHLEGRREHERAVLEHERILKFGPPPPPPPRPNVISGAIRVRCTLCGCAFDTPAITTPMCIDCRRRLMRDGFARFDMYSMYREKSFEDDDLRIGPRQQALPPPPEPTAAAGANMVAAPPGLPCETECDHGECETFRDAITRWESEAINALAAPNPKPSPSRFGDVPRMTPLG